MPTDWKPVESLPALVCKGNHRNFRDLPYGTEAWLVGKVGNLKQNKHFQKKQ